MVCVSLEVHRRFPESMSAKIILRKSIFRFSPSFLLFLKANLLENAFQSTCGVVSHCGFHLLVSND